MMRQRKRMEEDYLSKSFLQSAKRNMNAKINCHHNKIREVQWLDRQTNACE
jgi:hypothetical protein